MTLDSRDSTGHNLGDVMFSSAGLMTLNANGVISLEGDNQVSLSSNSLQFSVAGPIIARAGQTLSVNAQQSMTLATSGNLDIQNSPTSNGNLTLASSGALSITGSTDGDWTIQGNLFSYSSLSTTWTGTNLFDISTLGFGSPLLFSTNQFITSASVGTAGTEAVSITSANNLSGNPTDTILTSDYKIQFNAATMSVISSNVLGNIQLTSTSQTVSYTAGGANSLNIQATGTTAGQGVVQMYTYGFASSPIGAAVNFVGPLSMSASDSIRMSSLGAMTLTSTSSSVVPASPSSVYQASQILSMYANGFNGQLSVETSTLTVNSGPLAINANSALTGDISLSNSLVTMQSAFGQTWLAVNTAANGQGTIYIGAIQQNSRASVGCSFTNGIRLQSADQMQVTANGDAGAPLVLSAGNSLVVSQTGQLTGTSPGIELIAAYGDIDVIGGQAYLSSPTAIAVNALNAINMQSQTMSATGGQLVVNAREGDLLIEAAQQITFQATTQRISTLFQENENQFNIYATTEVLIDMIDLLVMLSDTTLESTGGSVQFYNDVYAYGQLSVPITSDQTYLSGSTCQTAYALVISTHEGLNPVFCVCHPAPKMWKCSSPLPA